MKGRPLSEKVVNQWKRSAGAGLEDMYRHMNRIGQQKAIRINTTCSIHDFERTLLGEGLETRKQSGVVEANWSSGYICALCPLLTSALYSSLLQHIGRDLGSKMSVILLGKRLRSG